MRDLSLLARSGYWLAIILVFLPLVDGLLAIWPFRPDSEPWRFAAIGTFSSVLLVPLLGLFLALALAMLLEHRRIQRLLAWCAALFAGAIGITFLLFTLDFLQTRATIQPSLVQTTDMAAGTTILKQVCLVLGFVLMSRAGFRGPQSSSGVPGQKKTMPSLILQRKPFQSR